MDNETVQILVQKEVSLYSQGQKDEVKAKKPSQEPTQPQTFLEDVLVDAAPKRRGRPPQAATLLANVSQSRVGILARAQAIIEIATPDESRFLRANDTWDPSPEQVSLPPPTQRFARSTLGQLQGARTRSLFDGESGPTRLTQNFAPSGLAQLQGLRTRSLFADEWSLQHDAEDYDFATGRRSPSPFQEVEDDISQRPNGVVNPLVEAPVKKSTESIGGKRKVNSLNVLTESPQPSSSRMPAKVRSGSRVRVKSTSSSESENVEIAPVTPKKSRRPRAKDSSTKKSARVQYDFGEKWELHMKEHITKDPDLHMRVLRYEPIHFDVFLELAQLYAPPSRQMKLQLQIFLDNQAIHFHGAEGIAWKR
ncbi:unnamed protein product [Cyclocybe aegerita]|uniref:Structure-specific endonuclease subunit SLX4 n=1 Tax=Cyclocybe aegerita TaxID=1973307 RepID=A0A8S0WKX2_CYCAE|nr:unnamed protein product [Cyclocybe aegerita]